jgi:RNase P/RNase MRP subunit POP5
MKYWNPETKVFILRVGRETEEMVQTALILLSSVLGVKCRVRILHVSGTLQKIEENMQKVNESWLSN